MALQQARLLDGQTSSGPSAPMSVIWVRGLIEAVEVAGVSAERFLRVAGVSPRQFANPYGWVEAGEFDRLASHAVELTGDLAFGLHWAERSPMMKFDLLSVITAHAPTPREALACLLRFQALLWKRPQLELVKGADSLLLRFDPSGTTELGLRLRAELVLAGLLRLLRYVGPGQAAVRRVAFAHGAPSYADAYVCVFGSRPRFDQPHTEIELAAHWLDRRLDDVNAELHQLLTIQANQVLARIQHSSGYEGRVREYLRCVFPRLPDMPETARTMAVSVRSLRRRLAEEGWSYTAILQESQLMLARQLLADPTRSIKDVGYDVGFSSTAAFHRAFKRWTGESPAAFQSASMREPASM